MSQTMQGGGPGRVAPGGPAAAVLVVRRAEDGSYCSGRVPGVAVAWGTRAHAAWWPAGQLADAEAYAADVAGDVEAVEACAECGAPLVELTQSGRLSAAPVCYRCRAEVRRPVADEDGFPVE